MTDTWTPEQFWRYAKVLIGAHECCQMRDEMAFRGLCVMSIEEIERLRAALEFVRDGYDNQDVNHRDYRVRVFEVATDALSSTKCGDVS